MRVDKCRCEHQAPCLEILKRYWSKLVVKGENTIQLACCYCYLWHNSEIACASELWEPQKSHSKGSGRLPLMPQLGDSLRRAMVMSLSSRGEGSPCEGVLVSGWACDGVGGLEKKFDCRTSDGRGVIVSSCETFPVEYILGLIEYSETDFYNRGCTPLH